LGTLEKTGKGFTVPLPSIQKQLFKVNVVQIAAGRSHTLILSKEGQVFSMGKGTKGQLGIGMARNQRNPTPIRIFCIDFCIDLYNRI
jgi:alpha-tubulin suppressor-like RCC1 family protein